MEGGSDCLWAEPVTWRSASSQCSRARPSSNPLASYSQYARCWIRAMTCGSCSLDVSSRRESVDELLPGSCRCRDAVSDGASDLLRLNTAFAFPLLPLVCVMLSGSVILAPSSLHPSQSSSDSQGETSVKVSPWDLCLRLLFVALSCNS